MTGDDPKDGTTGDDDGIVPFPFSRVRPQGSFDPNAPVVYGRMAAALGIPGEQTTGHWCSRCNKMWFGYLLEVCCPLCGNRHG